MKKLTSINKKYYLAVIIVLIIISWVDHFELNPEPSFTPTVKVALIPLDSRPCNTQYPQILGKMFNAEVVVPPSGLDNYSQLADQAQLWQWLEEQAPHSDKIIIATNELLQGGLIGSRDPNSYLDMEQKIATLKTFCETYSAKEIYILTVLPRLLPSQFTSLIAYEEELVALAKAIDTDNGQAEKIKASLPESVVESYLSLYEQNQKLAEAVMEWTEQGWVDHYLIGQDDAAPFGLSNKVLRELPLASYEKVSFVHGADELTSLLLARLLDQLPVDHKTLQLCYTDESCLSKQYPFESAPLKTVMETKLAYLGWQVVAEAPILEVAHTSSAGLTVLKNMPEGEIYTGLMDFAYINRGDTRLWELDIWNKLTGYAGWNTVSNTIGLELAFLTAQQNLNTFGSNYAPEQLDQALFAQMEYQFIRQAEELVYQGLIRPSFNDELRSQNLNIYDLSEHKLKAEEMLTNKYQEYVAQLAEHFQGTKYFGEHKYHIEQITSSITLPWGRTFEAQIAVTGQIAWEIE